MTIMNGKAELTEEQRGSLAERYRAVRLLLLCGPGNEHGNSASKILFHFRHSEVELLPCSCTCTTAICYGTGLPG